MFGSDQITFFCSGGDEGAAGEMIGSAEETAGALVDGGDGLFRKERWFDAGDL